MEFVTATYVELLDKAAATPAGTRARVRACGCDDFVIKVPNSAGRVHLEVGASVRVGWRIEDCRALDVS